MRTPNNDNQGLETFYEKHLREQAEEPELCLYCEEPILTEYKNEDIRSYSDEKFCCSTCESAFHVMGEM